MEAGSYIASKHYLKWAKNVYFNLLAAFITLSLADVSSLLSNQAVSYSMLQFFIMWLALFSVFFYRANLETSTTNVQKSQNQYFT